jgi:hypothetical protein
MPWLRFSILQLLLAAALCALLCALGTASWRAFSWRGAASPVTPSRTAEAFLLAAGFIGWSITWGLVARSRQRLVVRFAQPTELRLVWGLMFVGGVVAVTVPVGLLVIQGPLVWPGVYYALCVGLVLIAGATQRRTHELGRLPILQMTNLLACDWVNFVLGVICHGLLRRPHVQGYLNHVKQIPRKALVGDGSP